VDSATIADGTITGTDIASTASLGVAALSVSGHAMVGTALHVGATGDPLFGMNVQTCRGSAGFVSPGGSFSLTCDVVSPLGGSKMLVLPEMWVPGNGCIVTTDKPRVVIAGNNFGVTGTFTNRCGSSMAGSEGGLAWLIVQIAP
jgi:hypothetical protein